MLPLTRQHALTFAVAVQWTSLVLCCKRWHEGKDWLVHVYLVALRIKIPTSFSMTCTVAITGFLLMIFSACLRLRSSLFTFLCATLFSIFSVFSLLWCEPIQAQNSNGDTANVLPVVHPVKPCDALKQVDLKELGGAGSEVLSATETSYNNIAVCAVEGKLAPQITFKTLLPLQQWSQRYLQLGCGGLCGNVSLQVGAASGCVPLKTGSFVIASTDMGHQGMSGDFGADKQLRVDFAYRAVHLTALASKKLITAFYGQPQKYAYFSGCSDGGREALMEAQRFPQDFDGIIAGAAAMNFQVQNGFYHAWLATANTGADGKAILTASRLPLLHNAVLKACDGLDGQVDGLISDPLACHFDPASIACPDGNASSKCLSAAEVNVIRHIYAGPRDPRSGRRLIVGGPQYGSELGWAGVFVPSAADQPIFSEKIALDALRNLIFKTNPPASFRLRDLHFDAETFARMQPLHALYDATNPDLRRFAQHGGKLILWHGWADPHISPMNTIAYHEAVHSVMGNMAADAFERLYLIPGMYHCGGGEGPSQIDLLTPMLNWVEQQQAPQAIIASSGGSSGDVGNSRQFGAPGMMSGPPPGGARPPMMGGSGDKSGSLPPGPPPGMDGPPSATLNRTDATTTTVAKQSRPLYPYPYLARYSGSGDVNAAGSYEAADLTTLDPTVSWIGAAFYKPYVFRRD